MRKAGFESFLVGGIVRDMVLKRTVDNIDIATSATPGQVESFLKKNKIGFKTIGKKFGTILALVGKLPVEITTFRKESGYSDRRHPDEVMFSKSMLADAQRRDLTINALYYDPDQDKVFDPTNYGLKDLEAKLIRLVGDPKKRIDEDPLRMLRAVRLSIQLGFRFEKKSFAALKTRAKLIKSVSGERIKAELDKILLADAESGLRVLDKSSLLQYILPELTELKKINHRSQEYHLEGDMFEHTLLSLRCAKKDLNLLYAVLCHDLGKARAAKKVLKHGEWVIATRGHAEISSELFGQIAKRLKFSRKSQKLIDWAIKNHMYMFRFHKRPKDLQAKLAFHPWFGFLIGVGRADDLGNLRINRQGRKVAGEKWGWVYAQKLQSKVWEKEKLIERLSGGEHVKTLSKLSSGKKLGMLLQEIRTKILFGEINSQKDLKKFLKRHKNT